MTAVAIIVPGIMGSVLKLDDEIIWPGSLGSLWLPYKKMTELLRDDLIATDCIRTFSVTTQYQALIDDLTTCGFSEAEGTLIIAAYDWRKDNADAAKVLADHIDKAVARFGAETDISIIAHSMGGLISRYYLETGQFHDRPGFGNILRLITLGTPHTGAALALPMVLGREKQLFLSKDQVLLAARDPRYPAAYQLLPPEGEPFAWAKDAGGTLMNVYDQDVAKRLGLVQANLDKARRFHGALNFAKRPDKVRYFCFAGTQQTTATHVLLRDDGHKGLRPDAIEEKDGGDGTVPTWSAFLPRFERQFVGGEHATIYQTRELRRVLATLLGKPGTLFAVPASVEVAVRDRVVEPENQVHVTINFGQSLNDFSGVLTVERARLDDGATKPTKDFDPPIATYSATYQGVGMDYMSLVFEAPDIPGAYRVAFRDSAAAAPSGYDELIVQQPE
jgi:pimeloyl-ACP methyl ester carboxylesterase